MAESVGAHRAARAASQREVDVDLEDAVIARMDGSPFAANVGSGHLVVAADRAVVAHRHRADTTEAGRPTRRTRARWCVAGDGLGAVRQGHPDPDRRGACAPTAGASIADRGVAAARPAVPGDRPGRRVASRAGRDEPGRGVGVHDGRRPDAGDRRVRRAAAGAVTSQGATVAAAVRRGAGRLGRRRASAQQRRLVGAVRRRRAHRRRRQAAGPPSATARAVARPLGGGRPVRCRSRQRRRSPSGRTSRSSPAPRSCATASVSAGRGLAGGVVVQGSSWANDIVRSASEVSMSPVTQPEGFSGALRTYQAEAVAWIGFLDAAGLGGCLALDMGLGKTPTVLAHLARSAGDGKTLVIAPAAVVGNWAAEAARFTPGLRTVVHHGASTSHREGARGRDRRRRHGHHHVRDGRARRRRARRQHVAHGRARRGAGDQEPDERHVAAAAPHQGARRGSRSPARRSRTGSATCGRSSTSRTPVWSDRGRRSSPRCRATARPRCVH